MNKVDVIGQIEEELTWRVDELYFLKNQLSLINKEIDKDRYRKSLIVMLYSYYEGFCKSAFQIYVDAINSEKLIRSSVNLYLRTSSLNNIFLEYGNETKKDPRFKKLLPEDSKLHKYSRQISFVDEFTNFLTEIVAIPEDVVDTESNLKPIVLKKMLYRLGFPLDKIDISEHTINKLLNYRNNISHGSQKLGIQEADYESLEKDVLNLMESIRKIINNAIYEESFLEKAE